jgi:hypothetical protein
MASVKKLIKKEVKKQRDEVNSNLAEEIKNLNGKVKNLNIVEDEKSLLKDLVEYKINIL